jgi:hypothetical protein
MAAGVGHLANIGALTNIGALAGIGTGATGGRGTGPAIVIAGAGEEGGDAVAFDPMLDEVRPGDLITSDFMMRLLARINRLEAVARTLAARGEVLVPDLFGQSLSATLAAVQASDGLLRVGRILDTAGQQVSASQPGTRVVLGQHPAPGEEVDRGTRLNLLVSFVVSSGQQPAPGGGTGSGIGGIVGIGDITTIPGATIGGAVTPGPVTTVPGVTAPAGPRPEEIEITTNLPGLTAQPGTVTNPAVTQPAVTQPGVAQPAVTQPGVTIGGTASVPVSGATNIALGGTTAGGTTASPGGTIGGATNVAAGGLTGAITGGVTGATVGGTSTAGINTIAGGIAGGAILSEEAPTSEETPGGEEAPRSEEAPKRASKGATKARRSPKK